MRKSSETEGILFHELRYVIPKRLMVIHKSVSARLNPKRRVLCLTCTVIITIDVKELRIL